MTREQRIAAAIAQIDEWIQPAGVEGCAVAVTRDGALVASRVAGESRPGVAVSDNTLFGLASLTKPIATTGALAAIDAGRLSLDEPIGRLVPEFIAAQPDDPRRARVTLRQLLSHTAGLAEDGPTGGNDEPLPTLEDLVDRYIALPLADDPGTIVRYANTGFAILTRVIERATGEDFWSWTLANGVNDALQDGIVVRPDHAQSSRIAHLRDASAVGTPRESYNSDWWRQTAIPWGGAYGTADAAARFAASFLTEHADSLPLSPAVRRAAVSNQTGNLPGGVGSGRVWWPEASWGLGWEIKGSKRRHWSGELSSPATYCHFGQAGTLMLGDPASGITLAVLTNRSVAKMWGFILTRWLRLSNAVMAAAT